MRQHKTTGVKDARKNVMGLRPKVAVHKDDLIGIEHRQEVEGGNKRVLEIGNKRARRRAFFFTRIRGVLEDFRSE